jgi:class 3 adenylate cyclase/tetratricopeptide (TPR) repeat protein
VNCAKCGHANPAGTKFCGECGARLAALCPACRAENPPGNKFCGQCGAALASAQQPTAGAAPPRHLAERILQSREALEGERKQVTVLFADLKGSMELLSDRDPEEARALLDPVLKQMMEAVHTYEGTVNQVMGDGIMALFGAPLALEDHAVRACYAALRMQDAMRRYTDKVRAAHGVEIQIRVGLNSGEVVVRSIGSDLRMDYTAVGQTTHLAARMEQLATPGTIRLTATTFALAEGYVEAKAIGPVPVKGLAQPVEVLELTGAAAARTRLQVARARGLTRFVGRSAEMTQLQRAAAEARAGRGQIVAVIGEAGVGKSRLYYELVTSPQMRDFLVLESGSVSYGKATPFLPLADLLRHYFSIDSRDDVRTIRIKVTGGLLTLDDALRDAVPVVLWLLDALPEDSAFMALGPAERRRQAFDAVKRILLRENEVRPLIAVFEDLHWIDGETQAFLDGFIESIPRARILLAVNYRPEYRHGWANKTYYHQLRVDPLPPESADDLLASLLGTDPSVAALKPLLIARTEGRPLFIEESVRMLAENGALIGEPGSYRWDSRADSLQVPATVQAIIAARIDRLDAEDKRLLQAAAVIGTHVPFVVLKQIVEADEDRLRSSLGRLQAAEFVYEARIFPELEYAFKHALTHEVAYGGVLQERRQALHKAALEAIERVYLDRRVELVERLAHHAVNGRLLPKAVHYLREAGMRAVSRSANREAVAFFEQALRILGEMPQDAQALHQELETRIALGPALSDFKGPTSAEVEKCYQRALELVDQLGAVAHRFPVLWGLWFLYFNRGQSTIAVQAGERLLASAQGGNDSGQLLEAHHALWPTLTAMGRPVQATFHPEQGLALYDRERHSGYALLYAGHDPGACCRWSLAYLRWLCGYPEQAVGFVKDALDLVEELKHPSTTVFALWFTGWVHYQRGEDQLAGNLFERLIGVAQAHGLERRTDEVGVVLRMIRNNRVEPDDIAQLERQLQGVQSSGWRQNFMICALAEQCARQGLIEQGHRVLRSLNESNRSSFMASEFLRLEGELLQMEEQRPAGEAERRLRQAVDLARRREEKGFELRAAIGLARLLASAGRRDEARAALSGIYGEFSEGFDTRDLSAARALLLELGGKPHV